MIKAYFEINFNKIETRNTVFISISTNGRPLLNEGTPRSAKYPLLLVTILNMQALSWNAQVKDQISFDISTLSI